MSSRTDSLVSLAEDSVRRFGDRPLFGERRDGAWCWMTYRELGTFVDELRGGLAALGVEAGERVAIVSRNSSTWAAAAYATYGLGASFVPMYEAQRPSEWEFILRDCGATVVLGRSPEVVAALEEMRPRLPALRHIIAIDPAPGAKDALGIDEVRALGREHPIPAVHPDPEAIAGLVYTSGTTGQPKGVMLTHRNLASNVEAATSVFPVTPDDRTVSFLPWAHVYGQVVELHILLSVGASTAFNDDVAHLTEDLAEIKPTMLVAVPRIFNRIHAGVRAQIADRGRAIRRLFDSGLAVSIRLRRGEPVSFGERVTYWLADHLVFSKIRERFGGRLKYAISASATLAPEVGEFIDALGIEVYEGYGLTETSPVVTANRPGARKLGSIGQTIPGVTVKIDEEHGDRPGHGEIVVYGPNVMKGYHARPDENAKAFTADGGLHTGDLGYFDEDGYLFITGRIKEQYKLENGKYVMPTPLEEELALSPYIAAAMMHGQDRPYNVALIVLDTEQVRRWATARGEEPDEDLVSSPAVCELISSEIGHWSSGFRGYERPRAFVLTDDPFTIENGMLTPTLKVKRRAVVAKYGAALEALYAEHDRPPLPGADADHPAAAVPTEHVAHPAH